MRVRRAGQADADGIAGVIRSVYDEHGFTWDAEGYHGDLRDAATHYGGAFWIAEVDGEIVGTIGLELGAERVGGLPGCDCSLERLYVLERARGQGAGSALLKAAIHEARAHGRRRLAIWSDKRFEDAHRLYERFGARVTAERVHDDPDDSHEWGLVLEL
jgi:putative acetyltransferase